MFPSGYLIFSEWGRLPRAFGVLTLNRVGWDSYYNVITAAGIDTKCYIPVYQRVLMYW